MPQPIGLFDSGVGGLTVMREMIKAFPHEDLIYFADTARIPYGNKTPETVFEYALENALFLLEKKIKLLVIACFTASVHALERLEQKLSIPVVGMIPTCIDDLVAQNGKKIALLGTSSTIQSGILQSLIIQKSPQTHITSIPCPLFVPFIEEGLLDHEALNSIALHYLKNLNEIDAILLACTHYPLIKNTLQKIVGEKVSLIDSSASCVKSVKEKLSRLNLEEKKERNPSYSFYVTEDSLRFQMLGSLFLGMPIVHIDSVVVKK